MITVQTVVSLSQFRSCLDMRYKIYSQLGYIESAHGWDLDAFDWTSIHFAATNENQALVGTVRLILADTESSKASELESSERWCSNLLKICKMDIVRSNTLPILETLKENHIFSQKMPAERPAELSRIMVAPGFREKGICRMLSNAAVTKAMELGRDVLFLQCLPCHVKLFSKMGYQPIFQSLDYRFLTVPDRIVAMRMDLSPHIR